MVVRLSKRNIRLIHIFIPFKPNHINGHKLIIQINLHLTIDVWMDWTSTQKGVNLSIMGALRNLPQEAFGRHHLHFVKKFHVGLP